MARLTFPDEGSRIIYDPDTGRLLPAGTRVHLYLDDAATVVADDLTDMDGAPITVGYVQLDAYRRLPDFNGPNDQRDTLFAVVNNGPITAVYANTDVRLDTLATRVSTVEGTAGAAIPLTQRGAADGVATLDGAGTVPDAQIPATITRDAELTAAVSAAVSALIAGAPGALDTLDELAAAFGDDANFAATVTTALAGKQPLDADLTDIAALSTTAYGRAFLALADAAAGRTALGLGTIATHADTDYLTPAAATGTYTPFPLLADLTVYVSNNGSDSNNGLSPGKAFATLDAAFAALAGPGRIIMAPGTFNAPTLPLRSGMWLEGAGPRLTTIQQVGDAVVPLWSRAWDPASGATPSGGTHLRDFRLVATATSTSRGIILADYYASIINVEVRNFGSDGIFVTGKRSDGTDIGIQMIENRYDHLTISGCHGVGFHVDTGNRCSDGFLDNLVVQGPSSGSNPSSLVVLETSAGWQIGKVHVYGTTTDAAMMIIAAWSTTLVSAQIEKGWTGKGLYVTVQQSFHANAISVTCDANSGGGAAVAIAKNNSATYPNDGAAIGTLTVIQEFSTAGVTAVTWDYASAEVKVGTLTRNGAFRTQITERGGTGAAVIKLTTDMLVTGVVRDSTSSTTMTYGGVNLAQGHRAGVSGNGAATKNFTIPTIAVSTCVNFLVTISTAANFTGAQRATYVGLLTVSVNGAGSMATHLVSIVAPTGFSANPAASVVQGTVTITFTPTDSDGQGSCGLVYCHP